MTVARSATTRAVVAAALLVLGAGCDRTPATTSPSPSAVPQSGVDRLTGRDTTIALDGALLRALAQRRVVPSAEGTATLEGDVLVLPVTGGDLTFLDERTPSSRRVLGRVLHAGAGLRLTGPDRTVAALEDLELDPDQSRVYARLVVDGVVVAERLDAFSAALRETLPLRPGDDAGVVVLQGSRWELTPAAAEALSSALGVPPLSGGLAAGVAETTVEVDR